MEPRKRGQGQGQGLAGALQGPPSGTGGAPARAQEGQPEARGPVSGALEAKPGRRVGYM